MASLEDAQKKAYAIYEELSGIAATNNSTTTNTKVTGCQNGGEQNWLHSKYGQQIGDLILGDLCTDYYEAGARNGSTLAIFAHRVFGENHGLNGQEILNYAKAITDNLTAINRDDGRVQQTLNTNLPNGRAAKLKIDDEEAYLAGFIAGRWGTVGFGGYSSELPESTARGIGGAAHALDVDVKVRSAAIAGVLAGERALKIFGDPSQAPRMTKPVFDRAAAINDLGDYAQLPVPDVRTASNSLLKAA